MQRLVCAKPLDLPLLGQFRHVWVEDGSTISLPAVLKTIWQGCGGNRRTQTTAPKTEAALKITVRWDLLGGRLDGPHLQAGRQHELRSVLQEQQMPAGSLWIADLGYWKLLWLCRLVKQGGYFLLRDITGIVLWCHQQRLDLLAVLPKQQGERLELLVDVGANKQLKGVRLIAERVPEEVAQERQGRYREYARASETTQSLSAGTGATSPSF